ncbi:MAG: ATP synthase F0 subunit B [Nitrospirae bacterium]|nr:ATP synthase F0 subunit B [Nitrospirota bacterium]
MVISKITKSFIIILTGLIAISGGAAYASESAQNGSSLKEWFWLVVNFLVLVGVIGYFLKKPLIAYYKQRTELLEKALKEAQVAKELAQRALNEIEQQLRLKDEEIKKIIEAATSAAESERDRLIAEGKETSAAIAELSEKNIGYELKKARDLIRQKAAAAAVELAAEKINKSMNSDIAGKLLDDSISKIGTAN